jgi:hypothetical protein
MNKVDVDFMVLLLEDFQLVILIQLDLKKVIMTTLIKEVF